MVRFQIFLNRTMDSVSMYSVDSVAVIPGNPLQVFIVRSVDCYTTFSDLTSNLLVCLIYAM